MTRKDKKKIYKGVKLIIALVAVLLLISVLGGTVKNNYSEFMKEYKGTEHVAGTDVQVEIPKGASSAKVASILHKAGLIKYEYAFVLRIKGTEYKDKLQPGTFTLNTGMSTLEMIEQLCYVEPTPEPIAKLTVPEGYTIEMIAAKCEEEGIFTAQEFLDEVASGKHGISYTKDHETGDYELQGFLFPATYDIYEDTTPGDLIDKMLAKFEEVYAGLDKSRIAELGYSDYEIITMASIVEREAKLSEERSIIAGVIYNRLNAEMMLQMCPTVLYPLTKGIYDKSEVTYDDLELVSPYNTYNNYGLPIGPICNPGEASIEAVLYPDDNNYLYYHVNEEADEGSHIFSEDYDGHINTQ